MIKNNSINYKTFKLIKVIITYIFIALPSVLFAQKNITFVEVFKNNDIDIENKIIISNDFVQFKNKEIEITLLGKNEIIELQLHFLGVKWSGNLNSFQKEYNNYLTITTDQNYHDNKISMNLKDSLIRINDAILVKDSIISFNDNYNNFNILNAGTGENILEFSTVKYKSSDNINVNSEIWFGYKLKENDISRLIELNTILQKITFAYGKIYSINLNYISKNNIPYFPLKVIEKNINSVTSTEEEVISFQQKEIDKNKFHSNNNYPSISLFGILVEAKKEISK